VHLCAAVPDDTLYLMPDVNKLHTLNSYLLVIAVVCSKTKVNQLRILCMYLLLLL